MDLTVIIPTYQRPQYAKRQIAFWSGRPVFVIVVDGSDECLVFPDQPCENIIYMHNPGTFAHRVGLAARLVTTKYVVLLPDDEFYVPDALRSCVNFLEKNSDYSSCKGVSLAFRRNKKNGECEAVSNNDNLRDYEVDCETPSERLCKHFSNYTIASIFAVQPTEVFQTIVNIFNKNRIYSTSADFELQISSVAAWMGKIKVLSELMWFRSMENANLTSIGKTPLQYWASEPDYVAERDIFVSDFKSVVKEYLADECPGQILKHCLERKGVELRKLSRDNRWKYFFERIIFGLWLRLPDRTIKPWVRRLLGRDKLLIEFCKELNNEGIKICFSEVEEIRDSIKKTPS